MMKLKRALISVSDKKGIVELCRYLSGSGVELISTGGTAAVLSENGIPFTPIEKITGNPEAFGGRMKTISFEIGSALLFRRDQPEDQAQAEKLSIQAIDLVVCNLYPFEKVAREKKPLPELIENIDIGGPTMVRAAAKNYTHVACLTSPDEYPGIIEELKTSGGLSLETRQALALKAFVAISAYDLSIAVELSRHLGSRLRYGENPHQRAALLTLNNTSSVKTLAQAKSIQGKEISYNNLLDSDQAFKCCSELSHEFAGQAVCVIVKHGTPCGVATHQSKFTSLKLAWDADSISAFGGILCFNQPVTEEMAEWMKERFVEVIIAPGFSAKALELFALKKNLRLLEIPMKEKSASEWTARSIHGGLLCQDEDQGISDQLRSVTETEFPAALLPVARFGLTVTKYLKSNCIGVFSEKANGMVILVSGVGQPNRLDCIGRLAKTRLQDKPEDLSRAVLVSDAFFPFRDSIDAAHDLGVRFIVQPGGSVRDQEVIDACNKTKTAMLFTGQRHFRH